MTLSRTLWPAVAAPEITGSPTGWTCASYAVALALTSGVVSAMWGVPLPLSDNLVLILNAQRLSMWEILHGALLDQELLRPLLPALYKVLFELSRGHYYLAFQGFHVAMLTVTVLLCVAVLHVRTAAQFAGAAVMVVVLLGIHTFTNVARELPIVPVTCCALALVLAFADEPTLWRDVLAVGNLLVAMFYVEIGLLVWVVHAAAFVCGRRGLSRAGMIGLTCVFGGYFVLRFFVLPAGAPSLFPRYTGLGFTIMSEDELLQRFGHRPLMLYAYNVIASIGSVLFSEPRTGVFEFTKRLIAGELRPWMWTNVLSSLMATLAVLWYVYRSRQAWRDWRVDRSQALVFVAFAVVVANAVISYPYSRDVTMSPAGLCYAVAVGSVVTALLGHSSGMPPTRRAAIAALLVVLSAGWSLRTVALTYTLRTAAFVHRNDWAGADDWLRRVGRMPHDEQGLALVRTLRQQALAFPIPNPGIAQPFAESYLGTGGY